MSKHVVNAPKIDVVALHTEGLWQCLGCGCDIIVDAEFHVMCSPCTRILDQMPDDAVYEITPYGPVQVGTFGPPSSLDRLRRTIADALDTDAQVWR